MEWKAKDIDVFIKEKDYIDTAVVPLIPVTGGTAMKQAAEKAEFTQLLSLYLERQFKGRMLLFPPCSYFLGENPDSNLDLLNKWEANLKEAGFQYIFFLTSDKDWEGMSSSVLFVPSVPFEHMEEQYKQSIMEEQLKKLMIEIAKNWQ